MSTQETQEITSTLIDFRQRVLQADKLRLEGDAEAASRLMPSRQELIQAVKAYRQSLATRSTSRKTTTESRAKANAIKTMDNLSDLFKK